MGPAASSASSGVSNTRTVDRNTVTIITAEDRCHRRDQGSSSGDCGDRLLNRRRHQQQTMASSYSAATAGNRRTTTVVQLPPPLPPPSGCVPNTPDLINSIMSIMNPFEHHYRSPASEDSTSSSTCSPVSPPRMQNICSSLLIKEELKLAIKNKQKNRPTPTTPTHPTLTPTTDGVAGNSPAATASMGSAASSPGSGQAKKRRTDEESHGDEEYDDDEDVSSHGEGVSILNARDRRKFGSGRKKSTKIY